MAKSKVKSAVGTAALVWAPEVFTVLLIAGLGIVGIYYGPDLLKSLAGKFGTAFDAAFGKVGNWWGGTQFGGSAAGGFNSIGSSSPSGSGTVGSGGGFGGGGGDAF